MAVPAPVVDGLRAIAVEFATCGPGSGFDDLEPLRGLIGDARLVGLGEATHGTHEFFAMKHRILEFLVEEMGFRTFAIEANWPECEAVNRFVLTGEGDPQVLLGDLRFWTWYTEEVLALILWMRDHNQAHPDSVVSFRGFDSQYAASAAERVLSYLGDRDPPAASRAEAAYRRALEVLADPPATERDREKTRRAGQASLARMATLGAAEKREIRAGLANATSQFAMNPDPDEAHTEATLAARIVEQAWQIRGASSLPSERRLMRWVQFVRLLVRTRFGRRDITGRDAFMAHNVEWLLNRAGPDSKAVLWAHNAHVMKSPPAMGNHLKERFGDGYRAVGFCFGEGRFVARTMTRNAFGAIGAPEVHAAPKLMPGSFEDLCRSAALSSAVIDLRAAHGALANWLRKPRRIRHFGAAFNPKWPPGAYALKKRLPEAFDALIYFDETSAANSLDERSS